MSFVDDASIGTATAVAPLLAAAIEPLIGGELPIKLIAWDGSVAGPAEAPVVWLRSAAALRRMLWCPNELGAAQAYVCGDIDVDGDLGSALDQVWSRIAECGLRPVRPSAAALARLTAVAARLGVVGCPPSAPATQARMRGRLHSLSRDRAAIRHHYDMSNAFYRLILDPSMAYSCAYWEPLDANATLEQAQRDKLDRICRKLGLHERPDMWLLDVGCGWGSLSLHAAEHYDACEPTSSAVRSAEGGADDDAELVEAVAEDADRLIAAAAARPAAATVPCRRWCILPRQRGCYGVMMCDGSGRSSGGAWL